jgi:hypothetical protein
VTLTVPVKRLAISVFLIVHLAAVGITNLPACPLRSAIDKGWVDAYLMPTGLWQSWGMFAPEPAHNTAALEAVVRDSRGLVRHYAFPRMMDQSAWTGFYGGYRHSKYANNLGMPDSVANREFAARFVVRALKLQAADFPATVQLVYQIWPAPALDAAADAPPLAPLTAVIQTYNFPNLAETLP